MWSTLSPIALFASAQDFVTDRNRLFPVAIQMDHTPGTENVFWSTVQTKIQLAYCRY